MLDKLLTKDNLKLVAIILGCLLIVMLISKMVSEHMDNVVSIQHKDDYKPMNPLEDLVKDSINQNSAVINVNVVKPLNNDIEQSYPAVYQNSKISITPQPELEKQEYPSIAPIPVKPLGEMLEY
jgi:hypothetical protein